MTMFCGRSLKRIILFISFSILLSQSYAFGNILDDWKDSSAYKPNPILFLHGFALGSADSWNFTKAELSIYFDDYSNSLTFLEAINFDDSNGSIDTYDPGKTNPQGNNKGWADKVEDKVNELLGLDKYGSLSLNKLHLVCHSMGGLAAREYITNYKYPNSKDYVDKLITIATPHVGSPFANIKKIENATTGIHKYIWDFPKGERGIVGLGAEMTTGVLQLLKDKIHLDPEGEDIKDMTVGSFFLTTLNARNQPSGFKNYAIYGEVWHFLNTLFGAYYPNEEWICGDGIVPRDSQVGIDIMTNFPDTTPQRVWFFDNTIKIPADHFSELEYKDIPQVILKFLDSSAPEFSITSPASGIEIHENSIHLQGIVYKEYLPADTQLIINMIREDDASTFPTQTFLLKPSDLWIPNNPDSPVAEFDEQIIFSGSGTYRISCQLKNPAGQVSDIKELTVNVRIFEDAYVFVHCHNPEGKEIASIQGVDIKSVSIYDGDTRIGYGAQCHYTPLPIPTGTRTIKAKFNGMTKEQVITIKPKETKVIIFTFNRVSRHDEIKAALDAQGTETFEVWGPYEGDCGRAPWKCINNAGWHNFATVWGGVSDYNPGVWRATVNTSLSSSQFHMDINFIAFEGLAAQCMVQLTNWDFGCEVENLIPATTDFNSWFVQGFWGGPDSSRLSIILLKEHKLDRNAIKVKLPDYSSTSQYFIGTILANKTYNSVGGRCYQWPWWHTIFGNVIAIASTYYAETYYYHPMTLDLIFNDWKFSSVPYDLTGSGR